MTPIACQGFAVLPESTCFPIRLSKANDLFSEVKSKSVMGAIEDAHMINFWNKHTAKFEQNVKTNSSYVLLAKKFCPKVFGTIKEYF